VFQPAVGWPSCHSPSSCGGTFSATLAAYALFWARAPPVRQPPDRRHVRRWRVIPGAGSRLSGAVSALRHNAKTT